MGKTPQVKFLFGSVDVRDNFIAKATAPKNKHDRAVSCFRSDGSAK
jgi:hypothetical protein